MSHELYNKGHQSCAKLDPNNFSLTWFMQNDITSSSGVDIYRYYRYALAYRNIDMNFRYCDNFYISLITVITA